MLTNDKLKTLITNKRNAIMLLLVIIMYFFLSLFFLNCYRYQINPDAIYDISIAIKYSKGLFFDAVNGYRSPLISLLLVPFIWLNIEPLLAYKIINIICGFIILVIINKTIRIFKINFIGNLFLLIFSIPILLYFIFKETTPDILSAIFILLFFNLLISEDSSNKYSKSLYFGLVTGFGYLAKAYNLIFFLALLIIIFIVELVCKKYNKQFLIKNFILIICIVLIISLPYIVSLSIKYGKFSFSTIGEFTYKLYSPDYVDNSSKIINHLNDIGLGNNFIVDDNSFLIDKMDFWFDFKFLLRRIIKNFYSFFRDVDRVFLVASSLVFLILNKTDKYFTNFKIYLFFLIYIFGYSAFSYTDRLFCSLYFLGFILVVAIFSYLHSNEKNINKIAVILFLLVVSISFVKFPINYLKSNMNLNIGYDSFYRGEQVKELNLKGRVAANEGSGRDVLYITYYNRDSLQYLGSTNIDEELRNFSIDYYFCDKQDKERLSQLKSQNYKIVYEIDKYYIFKIK